MKSTDLTLEGPDTFGAPEETPYCQIYGREISEPQCHEMQGGVECFGCAATTRLCERCKRRSVAVSAVGLCGQCIVRDLLTEKIDSVKGDPLLLMPKDNLVRCQIVKKEIGIAMCSATQGDEGCRGCAAPSRICEKCKKRLARYPQYGLCLTCSIEDYGEGWDPNSVVIEEDVSKPVPAPIPLISVTTITVKRTDSDAGKESKVKALIPPVPEDKKFSVLVVGAVTSKFDVATLRNKRIRHWDAEDVKTDGEIPSATEKLIYCSRILKRAKTALLKRLISEARDRGHLFTVWDVTNQERLRDVLRSQLQQLEEEDQKAQSKAELEAVVAEALEPVEPQPEIQPVPVEGGDLVGEYKTQKQIVRENFEATGGDTDKLLKLVQRHHPNINRHAIHCLVSAVRKEKRVRGGEEKTDRPAVKRGRNPKASPGNLSGRMMSAVAKIQEGLAELNMIASEIGGMDARLQLLAPFEEAMRRVGSQLPGNSSKPSE